MRFADDLLQRYLRHFDDNESESLHLFIHSILEQMDHQAIVEILRSCPKEELHDILVKHLSHSLIEKLEQTNTSMDDDYGWRKVQ